MPYKDLKDFFTQVRSGKVSSLEQLNFLEELTDRFQSIKLNLLIKDLKLFREEEKRKLLSQYKKVKKTNLYKKTIKNGDPIPFVDFYEAFKFKGIEDKLPENFYLVEGEKYLAWFFPTELTTIDQLLIHLSNLQKPKEEEEEPSSASLKLISNIQWQGEHIEFAEIIKALIESKKISGTTEKSIFEDLCLVFGVKDFNKNNRIGGLKKRIHDTTPLIHQLEIHLNSWINRIGP